MARFAFPMLALAALTSAAGAHQITVHGSLPSRRAPWTDTIPIARFNNALGTLTSVEFELSSTITGQVGVENLAPSADQATIVFSAVLQAQVPLNGTLALIAPTDHVQLLLAPFDGTIDFAGTSGAVFTSPLGHASTTGSAAPADFTGLGTVDVPVGAVKNLSVLDATDVRFRGVVDADATLRVTYTYTPAPDCDGDGIPDADEGDCDGNGVPNDCEPDCDDDGIPDACEPDADGDGLPDDCDVDAVCEPGYTRAGSLLVFPAFDTRGGANTLLTVTNVDLLSLASVDVHFVFVNGADCATTHLVERLTANDTFTAYVGSLLAVQQEGYVYAYAQSTSGSGAAIAHDRLIGSAVLTDGVTTLDAGYSALSFRSPQPHGSPTDLDLDGFRALDGVEYEPGPAAQLVPRFLGTGGSVTGELVLFNLTGSAFGGPLRHQAVVNIMAFNDNEELYSAQTQIDCWQRAPLSAISGIFTNVFLQTTNHDPLEVFGQPGQESGWVRLVGSTVFDPKNGQHPGSTVLALLIEGQGGKTTASLPFHEGTRTDGRLVGQ